MLDSKQKTGIIGRLRQSITIQQPTRSADGLGGYTNAWNAISGMPVYALIEPYARKSGEKSFAGRLQHNVTHVITVRYLSTVTAEMRVSFGSRVFQVHGFTNFEERNIWTRLLCEEGTPS